MSEAVPVIYVLHGDDEFAISQRLAELEQKLGDPATAAMNTTRLDGRSCSLENLLSNAASMPFLAKRRLVIVTNPLVLGSKGTDHNKLINVLERIPPTAAVVMVEFRPLTEDKDLRRNKMNWLEKWAGQAGDRVSLKKFVVPKDQALAAWIQERAKKLDGKFNYDAASALAVLTGGDPRQCDQEIRKLLAYVNYRRPVDLDDVQTLTADTGQGDIFKMVDALAMQDGRNAISALKRLLETGDPIAIFGMIVRQFRLLVQAREILDDGGQKDEVLRQLHLHPYVAEKLTGQARRFTLPVLENVYRRLLDIDLAVKTGDTPYELALDAFVAGFTSR